MAARAVHMSHRLKGLYAITDDRRLGPDAQCGAALAALRGGARLIQYRDKGNDRARRLAEAGALAELCRAHQVPFIVNDDLRLAIAVQADGVHLGCQDPDIACARRQLPPESLIGVSCYADFDRARHAASAGADYIAFGSFYPSQTKPGAVRATPDLLARANRELHLPTVAIGGITPENGAALLQAGADMLAVISAVFAAPDIAAAARAFSICFKTAEEIPQ